MFSEEATGLLTFLAVTGAAMLHRVRSSNGKKPNQSNTLHLPTVDLQLLFDRAANPEAYRLECKKVADALHLYGLVIIKDPRVFEKDNDTFINMLERYFGLSDGKRDARPELAFQVGVTPEKTERAKDYCKTFGAYGPDDKPLSICPPELDPKWRFFWRIGPQPDKTRFPALNAAAVVPPEIPEWPTVMDSFGEKMINALYGLAEMAAVGFDMQPDVFVNMMKCGPHLLAPTGSDFNKYSSSGTVLAAYHYDLNFLTIHGKSRFPGLSVWSRAGKKLSVAIPDGCLLVQAGKQIEYATGGHVCAGFHEVVVNDKTVDVINAKRAKGESLWRVSSTLFGHLQSDHVLKPLPPFDTPAANAAYPAKFVGEQVSEELKAINLDQTGSTGMK